MSDQTEVKWYTQQQLENKKLSVIRKIAKRLRTKMSDNPDEELLIQRILRRQEAEGGPPAPPKEKKPAATKEKKPAKKKEESAGKDQFGMRLGTIRALANAFILEAEQPVSMREITDFLERDPKDTIYNHCNGMVTAGHFDRFDDGKYAIAGRFVKKGDKYVIRKGKK